MAKSKSLSRHDVVAVDLAAKAMEGKLRMTRFGIENLPAKATMGQAAIISHRIKTVEDGYQWADGYWLLWGGGLFGHDHAQLLDPEDGNPDTRSNRANVCKVFPIGSQIQDANWIKFSHYAAVYKMPDAEARMRLLQEAEANHWSVQFLREQVKAIRQNGGVKVKAHERAKSGEDGVQAMVTIVAGYQQQAVDAFDPMQSQGWITWEAMR